MIITELNNDAPELLHAMSSSVETCRVVKVDDVDMCDCRCNEGCVLKLPVFAISGGTDYQNDKSSFLYTTASIVGTGAMELHKKEGSTWVKKADLNNNALGTYFPKNTWTAHAHQLNYFGYEIEWENVLTSYGHGEYMIKTTITVFGNATVKYSDIYYLLEYTDQRADGTVRIHTIQNGYIKRGRFDWSDMNWNQYIRLHGYFGFRTPTFITEEYLTQKYVDEQIQDEIRDEFTLEINDMLNNNVSEDFIYNRMLANEIFITDYNLCNTQQYINYPVKPESFDNVFEDRYVKGRAYTIKFTDRNKDIIKRNYK